MTAILLIRHCEAEHHVNKLTGGWTDCHLTDLGRRQAKELAERVGSLWGGEDFSLYTSDLHRAKETADIIAKKCGIKPLATPALREMNNGKACGLTEIEAVKIANHTTENDVLDWRHYPGSETWREFNQRVEEFMEDIDSCSNNRLAIVAHRGTLINIFLWWLGYDLANYQKLPVSLTTAPGSISFLRYNKWGEKTIEFVNDYSHLKGVK